MCLGTVPTWQALGRFPPLLVLALQPFPREAQRGLSSALGKASALAPLSLSHRAYAMGGTSALERPCLLSSWLGRSPGFPTGL